MANKISRKLYAARKLFTAFGYIKIKHDEKLSYDIWLPLIITLSVVGLDWWGPFDLILFGKGGLLEICTNMLVILPGFYVAALTAVATFDRPTMDEPMSGDPPKIYNRKKREYESLTRRRFLSYLFGYLAISGFILYLVGAIANQLHGQIIQYRGNMVMKVGRFAFMGVYAFWFSNLMVTTFLGFHFLVERIHRPKNDE